MSVNWTKCYGLLKALHIVWSSPDLYETHLTFTDVYFCSCDCSLLVYKVIKIALKF